MYQWLAPLYSYIKLSQIEAQPLDYAYTSLFLEGIHQAFSENHDRMIYLLKRIGMFWWFGKKHIHHVYNQYSLNRIFASNILAYLDGLELGRSGKEKIEKEEETAILGMLKFIELFSMESGVPCRIIQSIDSIEVIFNECPFCKKRALFCRTFHGVVEGFIEWIHSNYLSDTTKLVMP